MDRERRLKNAVKPVDEINQLHEELVHSRTDHNRSIGDVEKLVGKVKQLQSRLVESDAECQLSRDMLSTLAQEICQLKEQLVSERQLKNNVVAIGSGRRFNLGLTKKLRRTIAAARSGINRSSHSALDTNPRQPAQMFSSATDCKTAVETAYYLIHGREPNSDERNAYVKLLKDDTPLGTVVAAIVNTSEATQIARQKAFLFANPESGTADHQIALAVRIVYQRWLGREPDSTGLH